MGTSKAHIRYKNKAGAIVPGVTTILNLLAKPQLIIWANRLGLQGIDSTKFRDDKADIGTLAHALVMADLTGRTADTADYTLPQIAQAETSFLQYLDWRKGKDLKPLVVETPLVSELYQFGGSPDYLGLVDGCLTLVDYKTGGVWKEAYYQCCAYRELLAENGFPLADKITILGIPRNTQEQFQEIHYKAFENGWEIFLALRKVYTLQKPAEKAGDGGLGTPPA